MCIHADRVDEVLASTRPGTVEKTDTDTDTDTDAETGTSTRSQQDRLWNVVVWNDPVNLMSYVTYVLQRLFGYTLVVATRLMLEVHHRGRSIVATVEREKGEHLVSRLHQYGLQATLERPDG